MSKPLSHVRYYFDADAVDRDEEGPDGEGLRCYTLRLHLDQMQGEQLERRLYPAQRMKGVSAFYCRELGFHGERGPGYHDCGVRCCSYEPRNGRNGCCRHSAKPYDADHTRPVVLHADGRVKEVKP